MESNRGKYYWGKREGRAGVASRKGALRSELLISFIVKLLGKLKAPTYLHSCWERFLTKYNQ